MVSCRARTAPRCLLVDRVEYATISMNRTCAISSIGTCETSADICPSSPQARCYRQLHGTRRFYCNAIMYFIESESAWQCPHQECLTTESQATASAQCLVHSFRRRKPRISLASCVRNLDAGTMFFTMRERRSYQSRYISDVCFGPTAPAGHETNWVQTVPEKAWNTLLRLYGPALAVVR